jgi:hypothetical protein
MRRTASITLACAVAALAGAVSPGAALAQKTAAGKVSVSSSCRPAVKQLERQFVVTGDMLSLRQGNRMEMRFDLYTKTVAEPAWKLVQAPDLGIWNRAKPGRTEYKFRQKTLNLAAPASYKMRVTFHWVGPGGAETFARRTSKVCEQRDPRPNLRVVRLDASPIKGGLANYQVVVRNVGLSAATGPNGFDVVVAVDGVTQPSKNVLGLRAGEMVQVNIPRAQRCKQGGTIKATVDPDQRIDQSDRADDVLELPCPASLAPAGS